jgi:hypothetical protein
MCKVKIRPLLFSPASCDFLRALIQEQAALGEEVEHNGSGVYFVGSIAIKADGALPKNSFVISLAPGESSE